MFFVIEIGIALYVQDKFIRPFFGDYLVVFLIYCFVLSFIKTNKIKIAFIVLIFSFGVEFLQYLNLITILGLQNSKFAAAIIGTSFAIEDLVCYFIGFLSILIIEFFIKKTKQY
jgi:hypothetical protein